MAKNQHFSETVGSGLCMYLKLQRFRVANMSSRNVSDIFLHLAWHIIPGALQHVHKHDCRAATLHLWHTHRVEHQLYLPVQKSEPLWTHTGKCCLSVGLKVCWLVTTYMRKTAFHYGVIIWNLHTPAELYSWSLERSSPPYWSHRQSLHLQPHHRGVSHLSPK